MVRSIPPEIWVEIPGFSSYIVSNHGRVVNINLDRELEGHTRERGMRRVVVVSDEGKIHALNVGELVASNFLSGYREGDYVKPIDGDRTNCAAWNLRFARTKRTGVVISPKSGPIERRHIRVNETGQVFSGVKNIAAYYGIDRSAIYKVLRGERESVQGFTFEYFWA